MCIGTKWISRIELIVIYSNKGKLRNFDFVGIPCLEIFLNMPTCKCSNMWKEIPWQKWNRSKKN